MILLIVCSLLFCAFMRGLAGCGTGRQVSMETPPVERPKMEQKQQGEYPLHVFVSNQGTAIDIADLEISIDSDK